MIASSKEDPDQEYMCKFTVGQDSILGAITDEHRGDFGEGGESDVDEEDDGYVEDEEGWEE